jgi:hypothetical protein
MKVFEFRLFLIFKRLNARLEMDLLKLLYIFIFCCWKKRFLKPRSRNPNFPATKGGRSSTSSLCFVHLI